jgi:hypothetical protein
VPRSGQLAVIEDRPHDRVGVDQALEHLVIDRVPGLGLLHAVALEPEPLEQQRRQLLG